MDSNNNQSTGTIFICTGCRRIKTPDGNWKRPESEVERLNVYRTEYALCNRCRRSIFKG